MALFAMMNKNSAVKVYRIDTDKKTDADIVETFHNQQLYFEAHHCTELPFEAGYKPSYNECSVINKFTDATDLLDAVKRSTAMPVWDKNIGLENITALFMATEYPNVKNRIAIQSFSKKQILNASKYLWLRNNVFSLSDLMGFNLDDKLVAIIEDDKIKFRNFNNLRSIFDMNKYFSLATEKELESFVKQPIFDLPQGFDLNNLADTVIRKKVTLINESGILTKHTMAEITGAATTLKFDLKTSGTGAKTQIVMPSTKKEIKELLDFLDEDYFNSEITKQRFRSNSKRKA
jgi:hypothetical protein